jgi:thiosulfate reductase cytochrome b subunit
MNVLASNVDHYSMEQQYTAQKILMKNKTVPFLLELNLQNTRLVHVYTSWLFLNFESFYLTKGQVNAHWTLYEQKMQMVTKTLQEPMLS